MHLPLSGTLEHVSVGCNRIVGALSWSDTDFIAYAAHNAIVVANPNSSRVLATLLGHTDIVNCVHWFPSSMHPQATTNTYSAVLASGSADKTIKIWLWSPSSSASSSSWSCAATLQGSYHSAPITSIALHHDASRNTILLISTSGDGSVCIWQHNNNNTNTFASWHLRQKLQLSRPETALCAAISSPPPSSNTNTNNNNNGSNRDSWLILALGCIDGSVSLWVAAPHQGQEGEGGGFKKACKLQGHQDWIRGLDFIHVPSDTAAAAATNNNNSDSKTSHGPRLLLASASQDKYVRVWSIRRVEPPISSIPAAAGVANSGSNSNSIVAHLSKYAPRPVFDADGMCSAVLEALLIGHEDWVHSVQWKPQRRGGGGTNKKRPCLLSSSMDRTMMLWEPDVATGLWMATSSLGDAGANHLGYYTATFSPTGTGLIAHGYTGALHLWKKEVNDNKADNGDDNDDDNSPWVPQPAPGGHFGPVVSLCWAADNHCVLSVSTDQTARMLTQMKKRWCEIARPQVHGHDFYGVAALQNLRSKGKELTEGYYFASASEEKVIRVFQAPRAFEESLALATGIPLVVHTSSTTTTQGNTNGHHNNQNQNQASALGASLPALGLSNKAVYTEITAEQQKTNNGDFESYQGPDFAPFSTPGVVSEPPVEEHLAQSTLWPEIHKLYGHGNEVYCLSGDPLGRWIVSASKAQSVATAGIRLWDTDTWSVAPGKPLEAHTLTVTQLAFSPNGKYLASCSRDRSVAVFVRTKEHGKVSSNNGTNNSTATGAPFTLGWKGTKAHSRIVWSVHWSPDSLFLASSSRDGVIKIWSAASVGEGVGLEMKEVGSLSLGDSVRSVGFAPRKNDNNSRYSLAVGLEGGDIKLFTVDIVYDNSSSRCVLEEVWQTSVETKHAAAVRMLAWKSRSGEIDDVGEGEMLLASCGDDHAVRIYRF